MSKMGMKNTEPRKPMKKVSKKTSIRNKVWHEVVVERAGYLMAKYGFIVCEYSGEIIATLRSVSGYPGDGWGHHIDGDRNNIDKSNCYIVKYKYHQYITDHNTVVSQEDFQGRNKNAEV